MRNSLIQTPTLHYVVQKLSLESVIQLAKSHVSIKADRKAPVPVDFGVLAQLCAMKPDRIEANPRTNVSATLGSCIYRLLHMYTHPRCISLDSKSAFSSRFCSDRPPKTSPVNSRATPILDRPFPSFLTFCSLVYGSQMWNIKSTSCPLLARAAGSTLEEWPVDFLT